MWMSKDDVTKIGEGKDVDQPYILVYTYSPSFYAGLRYNEKTLFLIYLHSCVAKYKGKTTTTNWPT